MKKAIITGINGQDGSYLAELLLSKDYEVIGTVRRSSNSNTSRIDHIKNNITIVEAEVSDSGSVYSLIESYKPDEVYNLAAQSHVGTSFKQPSYTFTVNALGPMYLLEAINKYCPNARFYQASTSEMFGSNYSVDSSGAKYQDENTPFKPQSPYGIAKLAAHNTVRIYRESYGIHASAGILFNHESERRGENFVTRKITKWIADYTKILLLNDYIGEYPYHLDDNYIHYLLDKETRYCIAYPKLRLGSINVHRDWGHAEDYVYAMWLMLQQDEPDDYVIATGETHTIKDFLREAMQNELVNFLNHESYYTIDKDLFRPAEVDYLKGNPAKAKSLLGWKPKVSFKDLVLRMLRGDLHGKEQGQKTV